jgi:hypothetical protein
MVSHRFVDVTAASGSGPGDPPRMNAVMNPKCGGNDRRTEKQIIEGATPSNGSRIASATSR